MTDTAWDASLYDKKHAFVWEKARGLVEWLAPQPGEHVLDLGCGTGQLSSDIAAAGATVTGIDSSPRMIAGARAKFPSLHFEVCDARALPFVQQFDAVFSNAALHWVTPPDLVVAGIARSLKPGGRFVAEFGGKGNIKQLLAAFEGAASQLDISPRPENPWYFPSLSEYASLLERHGLQVRNAILFHRPTALEDGESGLSNWMAMFGEAFLRPIPDSQRSAYVAAVERLARPTLWRSDHWELDYCRLRISALKADS